MLLSFGPRGKVYLWDTPTVSVVMTLLLATSCMDARETDFSDRVNVRYNNVTAVNLPLTAVTEPPHNT